MHAVWGADRGRRSRSSRTRAFTRSATSRLARKSRAAWARTSTGSAAAGRGDGWKSGSCNNWLGLQPSCHSDLRARASLLFSKNWSRAVIWGGGDWRAAGSGRARR